MSSVHLTKCIYVAAAPTLTPVAAFAASPFDGTWKTNLAEMQLSHKPIVVELTNNGEFICSGCVPPYTAKADGSHQCVTGQPFDSVAITMDANAAFGSLKLHDRLLQKQKIVVSGYTMTREATDVNGAQPVVQTTTWSRASTGPAGSHPLSGSWQLTKVESISVAGAAYTYSMSDDGFIMSWNGQSYDAKFDGKKYPIAVKPTNTSVIVKKLGPTEIEERQYEGGKLVAIMILIVSADGKSMDVRATNVLTGGTNHYTRDKVS